MLCFRKAPKTPNQHADHSPAANHVEPTHKLSGRAATRESNFLFFHASRSAVCGTHSYHRCKRQARWRQTVTQHMWATQTSKNVLLFVALSCAISAHQQPKQQRSWYKKRVCCHYQAQPSTSHLYLFSTQARTQHNTPQLNA